MGYATHFADPYQYRAEASAALMWARAGAAVDSSWGSGGHIPTFMRVNAVQRSLVGLFFVAFCLATGECSLPSRCLLLREKLATALGPRRIAPGRIMGLPYAPEKDGAFKAGPPLIEVRQELRRSRSMEALASEAIANLTFPDHLDEAISQLQQVWKEAPGNAWILSDLSVAYLTRGSLGKDPQSFFLALCAASAAVRLEPQLLEARFNLGLSLEKLFLFEDARHAYAEYLALDPDSAWADEVRTRRDRLSATGGVARWETRKPLLFAAALSQDAALVQAQVGGFQQAARAYVELELLDDWAKAVLKGDAAHAEPSLTAAREIARQHALLTPDRMLPESIAAIDQAQGNPGHQEQLRRLAEGHSLFAQGYRFHESYRLPEAARAFQLSEEALRRAGSPFHHWAKLFIAACDYQRKDYAKALQVLDAIHTDHSLNKYPNLQARCDWLRGLIFFITNRMVAARDSYASALSHYQSTGESGNQATMENFLFEVSYVLGDDRKAWQYLYAALAKKEMILEPRRRQLVARSAAEVGRRSGESRVALYFGNEAVRWALSSGNPVQIALALRDRANLHHDAGQALEAQRDLAAAGDYAHQAGDEAMAAEIQVAKASFLERHEEKKALAELTEALPVLVRTHYNESLPALYLQRGRLYARQGHLDLGRADFLSGIQEYEHFFSELDDASRILRLERPTELFEEMIRLEAATERGARSRAFEYAERSRGRALTELMARPAAEGSTRIRSLEEVASALPHGVQLIEFAVLRDQVLVWILGDGAGRSLLLPIRRDELERRVEALRAAIEAGGDLTPEATHLYEVLIAPLQLPGSARVVVIPDGVLHQVPFGVLKNAATGRYWIEDHVLELAPAASIYLSCAARSRALLDSASTSALVVADPAFDTTLSPGLGRLPAARREGKQIVSLYGRAELLGDQDATRAAFLSALGRHQVLHFGGHAEVDARSPFLSRLLLAPDRNDRGVLFAHEIYRHRFAKTRLVVLAACSTAGDPVAPTEGISSLARPFLAAGIPAVVGSLWPVKDEDAAAWTVRLHTELAKGQDVASALRTATLSLLHGVSTNPKAWAAFELIGAS
ncbi:MAG TPA: CHAT domain-containing protein [Thermoanaerobaculia bacterium]|nr:CHAT domain-containing protein [Thermoanaerobaculia bacterium]